MENNSLDSGLFNDSPSIGFHERVAQIQNDGFDFSIGECLSEGFEIFKQNVGGFIGFTLLLVGVSMMPAIVTLAGGDALGSVVNIVTSIVSIPLGVGFMIVAKKIYHNEAYDFNSFFEGFQLFQPLLIASVLVGLAVAVGFILLFIPGIYLAIAFTWTSPMIVFAGRESVEAMGISRKVVSKNWFKVFGFYIVLMLVAFAGILAFGIGIFVAIPVIYCASYVAYEKVIGANLK